MSYSKNGAGRGLWSDAGALSMEAALWLAMGLCAAVVVGVVIVVEVL